MSEAGKKIPSAIEKVFSSQDAEDVVKDIFGKNAFERRDQLGALETTENEYAEYKGVQELSSNLRSMWWKIENERAQIALQINEASKKKDYGKLSARQLKALNNKLDDLTGRADALSEIQSIILDGKTPDKIVKSFEDLANDYGNNLKNEDFLKASGDENVKKVSDDLKTAIGELTNYKNQIKFINSNNNENFMPESTSKENFSIINIQKNDSGENVGRVADDELAQKMANKANKMHNEWKKVIKDASNKEINEAIGSSADRAMEDMFKKETGMKYEVAVREAEEEMKGVGDEVGIIIKNDKKVIKDRAVGIESENVKNNIINDGSVVVQDLNNKVNNFIEDTEEKITKIDPGADNERAEELKDEKIEAVKNGISDKIKNIDGKIKILENSHGNPGDRRLYIAREAGIDIKQLTPDEEDRQKLIILARRRAEKAELQKVEEIANDSEIKNYDDLQNRLWGNYKSLKRECDKKGEELNKEPRGSDRRKKLVEEIRDLRAKVQMAEDSVDDFGARIVKEREEKNKKRQMKNQKVPKPEPTVEPQEPKPVEPKIDVKPMDVQPDSQPNRNERDEIIAAYDQRIENLRLGANEARQAGKEDRAKELEGFAREVENEKKWRLRNADGKDQGKGKNKDIKPQTQNKDAQIVKNKMAEPKNYDQEWQSLRERIKQAEKQAKESGDQNNVLKLEEELHKLEQEQRNAKAAAGEKDKEKNNETQKQNYLREVEQKIADLRLEIIAAEKADNNDKVIELENALREVQKEQRHLEGKEDKKEIIKNFPEIVLSDSAEKKNQLENKLREYKGRIDKYKTSETQMDTICKIAVLERLLKDGKINTQELASEMSVSFGSNFSIEAFDNACGVIEDYCRTGGENVKGGTSFESAKGGVEEKQSVENLDDKIKALQAEINEIDAKRVILSKRHEGARGKVADELEKELSGLHASVRNKLGEIMRLRTELAASGSEKANKEEAAEKEEPKEKTAEEILREKNIETYGGAEKLNQIFKDYKLLNELEDREAYDNKSPLFSEWDALRVKIANINLEIIAKDRTVDFYKIQNKDESIRKYFNTTLEESLEDFKKGVEKASPSVLAIRAATLMKYRNELKNCDWQGKDKYRNTPKKEYLETIKVLEQKIDILNGMLPKKEGASPEAALKDMSIDDFKKTEGEKVKVKLDADQTARVEGVLKEFNLTAEDAEKVEGFKDLSYGQRLLALENLRQLTLRDVRIGSVKKQKEEASQAQGFWKKLWTGIKKKYDIAKHEKSISQRLNKEDNLATLTQLTRGMKESKTDVLEKNGKLEFQYISGLENLTPEQAAKVQKFNEVASELSKMPMEWTADDSKKGFFRQMMDKAGLGQSWSPDDPTRVQYNRCQELTAEFQSLKQEVMQVVKQQKDSDLKKGGVEKFDDLETQSHAMAQMLQMENLLRCNRAMNVNPDAEKALMEIKSAPLWKRALNNIATEKGIYLVAGYALRSVSLTFLGTAGLVGAGAGMGGYMGYKRGKETLRENDALAQHKSFEETKQKRIEKFQRAKQGKTGPIGEMEKTEKKIEDANVLARNLNNFVKYIGKEDDPKRQMDLARRLRDRVKYVKTALDEGRINFGATDTRVASLYKLTDKLNDAVNCAEMYHPSTRHEDQWKKNEAPEGLNLKEHKHLLTVEQRLDIYLKDSKITLDAERWKYLKKQLRNGALYGAGFVTAGMMVREVASHIDPHLFNAQGETDLGVRWISDKGGVPNKPFIGGIVGKYLHGEPGGGGGELPPYEGSVPAGGGSEKIKSVIDQFNKDFRHHPEWKGNTLEQAKALTGLRQQLETAGEKNPDALKGIIDSAKDQLNGDGNIFIAGSQEAQNLPGVEATGAGAGAGAGGNATENTIAAAGAGKTIDAVIGAKQDIVNSAVETASGKMNSIWKMIGHQLDQRGIFKGLTGTPEEIAAKKTYMIDYFKDMVAKDPKGFGLEDIDDLQVGQKVDLSKLFESHPRLGEIIRDTNALPADKLASIFKHDQIIAEFHRLHPEVPIISENVDQIAAGHGDALLKKAVEQAASENIQPSAPETVIQPESPKIPHQPASPYEDMLRNNIEGRIKEIQRLTEETIAERLNKIFDFDNSGWMGTESEAYRVIKNEIADNFLKRNLPGEAGELQQYLKELIKDNHSVPKIGETVEVFMKRVVGDTIQEDVNKLLNLSK